MTFCIRCTLSGTFFLWALLPLVSIANTAEDAILRIEQGNAAAGVQRDGKRLALSAGDSLQEQDQIVTDASGRMSLRLGRQGFIEVGSDAEVGIERLPFATYAGDLKSIFSVSKGYLRVVWKRAEAKRHWPLFVYMAGHRVSLIGGEYFFQNTDVEQRACVAAGQLSLQVAGREGAQLIQAPACVQLRTDQAPAVSPRNADDWPAVRRRFDIAATAASLLATDTKPALASKASSASIPMPPLRATLPPETVTTTAPIVLRQAPVLASAARANTANAQTAPSGDWILNVASYAEVADAEQEVLRLRAAGFVGAQAQSQPVLVNGKSWYRVQVTGLASEAAATQTAEAISSKLGLKNAWVVKR